MAAESWSKAETGKCPYCERKIFESLRKRHIDTCRWRPENLDPCPVCKTLKFKSKDTCSHACANTYFRTRENHPNWKGTNYIQICFANHKKKCVICNEDKIVEVHHLDHNRKNNDPANLIPLCPTHHKYWHSRFRDQIIRKVHNYSKKWNKKRGIR